MMRLKMMKRGASKRVQNLSYDQSLEYLQNKTKQSESSNNPISIENILNNLQTNEDREGNNSPI